MSVSGRMVGLTLLLPLLATAFVTAQTVDKKTGKPVPKIEPAPIPAVEPKSDPTAPSDKLRQAMEINKTAPGAAPRIPVVVLRGRVLAKDKPPIALIELDPKQPPQPVTKGTSLTVGNVKLTVTEVTATEVRIEVSPLNETIVLR